VKRKGMAFYKDAMSHGNLYIKFLVQFPKKGELKDNQIKELQKVVMLLNCY
jgi:DnaJ-class molecular chaperone